MKRTIQLISILAVSLLIISCNQENKKSNKKDSKGDEVVNEANELLEATGDYVESEYSDFEERLEQYRDNTKDRLTRVNKWVDGLADEGKAEYREQVKELEKKQKELDRKIKSYKKAAAEKRKALKQEIEDLNDAISKAYKTFEKELQK